MRGFSLLELVIVIVVIGVLALVAAPRVSWFASQSKYNAAHAGFRNIDTALRLYLTDHGGLPPNAPIQTHPPELLGYLEPAVFTTPAPIGRAWDWNGAGSGINTFGVNISIHTTPPADRNAMEEAFDDGNPLTGIYRNQTHYLVWPVNP